MNVLFCVDTFLYSLVSSKEREHGSNGNIAIAVQATCDDDGTYHQTVT